MPTGWVQDDKRQVDGKKIWKRKIGQWRRQPLSYFLFGRNYLESLSWSLSPAADLASAAELIVTRCCGRTETAAR